MKIKKEGDQDQNIGQIVIRLVGIFEPYMFKQDPLLLVFQLYLFIGWLEKRANQ